MKLKIILTINILFVNLTYSQMDTIFTFNETIICKIKEVNDNSIKFSYPNEELINTIKKNKIQKIIFSSGRIKIFSEASKYKNIFGWEDWEKVTTTTIKDEIDGLYKLDDVSSKVKAGSEFSNLNKIKDKAIRKLKIRTAMLGGNIVFITNDHTTGVKYSWGATNTAEVILNGIAYNNRIPSINKFKELVNKQKNWTITKIIKMPYNKKTPNIINAYNKKIDISNYLIDNFFIFVKYNDELLKVISIKDNEMILMTKDKRRIINYVIKCP